MKIVLREFRKKASFRRCTSCNKNLPGVAFIRDKNLCLKCNSGRSIDRAKLIQQKYKDAAGGKWWLERYFMQSEIERRAAR